MLSYTTFFEKTFLFRGIDINHINELLCRCEIEEKNYLKGETIYSPEDFERKIGFVYNGECLVSRHAGGNFVPLNITKKYESFGIVTIFSDRDEFPTVVTAKNSCTVLFFSAKTLRYLIESSSQISINVITFLTKKISFLNDKVAAFSSGCVEEKLASYILSLKRKNNSLKFDFNKKKSAESLNCGRASLYRAIDALEAEGLISFENKKIIIINPEGLERILK